MKWREINDRHHSELRRAVKLSVSLENAGYEAVFVGGAVRDYC